MFLLLSTLPPPVLVSSIPLGRNFSKGVGFSIVVRPRIRLTYTRIMCVNNVASLPASRCRNIFFQKTKRESWAGWPKRLALAQVQATPRRARKRNLPLQKIIVFSQRFASPGWMAQTLAWVTPRAQFNVIGVEWFWIVSMQGNLSNFKIDSSYWCPKPRRCPVLLLKSWILLLIFIEITSMYRFWDSCDTFFLDKIESVPLSLWKTAPTFKIFCWLSRLFLKFPTDGIVVDDKGTIWARASGPLQNCKRNGHKSHQNSRILGFVPTEPWLRCNNQNSKPFWTLWQSKITKNEKVDNQNQLLRTTCMRF